MTRGGDRRRFRGATAIVAVCVLLCGRAFAEAGPYRLGGALELYGVVPTDGDSRHQDPAGILRLEADGEPRRDLRFHLALTGLVGGTPEDAHIGVFDLSHAFQNLAPSLEIEEAYTEWERGPFTVRAGKQKFAWGVLDGVQLNDWLNPEKWYDPILTDEQDRKIGVPALTVSYFAPPLGGISDLRWTIAWVPVHVPFRFPLNRERWFPPLAEPPATYRSQGLIPLALAVENGGSTPPRGFTEGDVGLRLAGRTHGVDWAFSYYEGFDPLPLLDVTSRGALIDGASVLEIVETPAFARIRTGGVDAAWTLGGFAVRAEVSYQPDRPFLRNIKRDLATPGDLSPETLRFLSRVAAGERAAAYVRRDAFAWGVGVDYPIDGWVPIFQVVQAQIFDNDLRLIVRDTETQLLASVEKRFFDGGVDARVVGVYGIESSYFTILPRVRWRPRDDVELELGYLTIGGSRQSLIGQFATNDEVYMRARYRF